MLDPFCGSGTIAIEAALMAHRIVPGKNRQFAFMDWPGFDEKKWKHQLSRAISQEIRTPVLITASDRDAGAIRMAQSNAERAGVGENIQFLCQSVSALQPPAHPGWIVTNPPYGVRISLGRDLRDLYAQFGNVLRQHCTGWNTGILCSSEQLIGQMHLNNTDILPFINGGLLVKLFKGNVG
jgi:putative N6-adenine-specific DNA methylase